MSPDHKCEPAKQVVPFWHDCKHCGKQIEPVFCQDCDGSGAMHGCLHVEANCTKCGGSGVRCWKEAQP